MTSIANFPTTRQGVWDLDNPKARLEDQEGNHPFPGQREKNWSPMGQSRGEKKLDFNNNVANHEHAALMIVGAIIAGHGVYKAGVAKTSLSVVCGMSMILTGAALIFRGVSGHCSVYAAGNVNKMN